MNATAEELLEKGQSYDVVTCLEVVEHVSDVDVLVNSLGALVKPGGQLFMSTLNRTMKSYLFGIVAAEYILGLCGKGTHDWNRFLTPQELMTKIQSSGLVVTDVCGLIYNPLLKTCTMDHGDTEVNYILCARKPTTLTTTATDTTGTTSETATIEITTTGTTIAATNAPVDSPL